MRPFVAYTVGKGVKEMLMSKPYDRARAVEYARRWALDRNPLFANFTGQGGDCTNFVSQCVYAGSCVMNLTPDFGWYYISVDERAPAWSGVEYFYDFMVGSQSFASQNGGVGPYATERPRRYAMPGDVLQLADRSGDWYHSLIISEIRGREIYVCAHSDDSLDRPLSGYNYANVRLLHIEGIRLDSDDDWQYSCLLNGSLPPAEPSEEGEVDFFEEEPEAAEDPMPEPSRPPMSGQTPPPGDRPEVIEGS